MKGSITIIIVFLIGVAAAYYNIIPASISENSYTEYVLYMLILFVGIGIGADKRSIDLLKGINIKLIMVPTSILLGTILGALSVTALLPEYEVKEIVAVAAGLGYYSLSSIFITEICGESLGVIALLANIFRELITLLFTPILVSTFGKLAGVASGGATSMDTCLPIITKYSGKEWVLISLFSGIVLTIVVPIIVPLILN